ncbi:hypothetical protein Nepgr_006388 [Nepenthes gracilis]|uniref:YTH domain-containing family protein n=1 Tax=Nepenthes gracilis TaxID=150966 RepID=A0AAD3S506_NEPGR|nr:hypothetical protein Nepgr_006388 [Nepenthes gracilis]
MAPLQRFLAETPQPLHHSHRQISPFSTPSLLMTLTFEPFPRIVQIQALLPQALTNVQIITPVSSPISKIEGDGCPTFHCRPLTKQPEQPLARPSSRELLLLKPVMIPDASGMVDWEEEKVDTGQVSYPHLLPIPVCRKSIFTLSKCHSSKSPPQFSSMKCGEGDSILLATTNLETPIHRTIGVCANRKSGLCIINLAIILFIHVKRALLPCWFSLSKLASGVDNVWFRYVRKDELTVVVKSSRDGWKEARALRERLEYQRGNVEGAFRRADGLVLEAIYLKTKSLQKLRRLTEAASECKSVLDAVERDGKDRIGMKWDIGQRKSKHLVLRKLHNIHLSIEEGIWATQVMNGPILEEVFDKSGRVILVFCVNMSGFFQDYAQMMSSVGCRQDNVWSQGTGGNSEFGVGLAWVMVQICDGTSALFRVSSFGLEYVTFSAALPTCSGEVAAVRRLIKHEIEALLVLAVTHLGQSPELFPSAVSISRQKSAY